jgi:hypothetical protein
VVWYYVRLCFGRKVSGRRWCFGDSEMLATVKMVELAQGAGGCLELGALEEL